MAFPLYAIPMALIAITFAVQGAVYCQFHDNVKMAGHKVTPLNFVTDVIISIGLLAAEHFQGKKITKLSLQSKYEDPNANLTVKFTPFVLQIVLFVFIVKKIIDAVKLTEYSLFYYCLSILAVPALSSQTGAGGAGDDLWHWRAQPGSKYMPPSGKKLVKLVPKSPYIVDLTMDFITHSTMKAIIRMGLPFLCMGSDTSMDFVKDLFAVSFVFSIDDHAIEWEEVEVGAPEGSERLLNQ